MRILYFSRDYTPHDHRFLTSLVNSGQEVFFLRLERGAGALEERPLPPAIQAVSWRGGQRPFRWRDLPALRQSLRAVVRQVRPDVLHAGPIQTAAFLGALSGFQPLVSMSWGSDLLRDAQRSRWMAWVARYTLRRSAVVVGDCATVRDKALSLGAPANRVYTFPWGIDLDAFSPRPVGQVTALRERLGWQDAFVVLSLRSWEPVYGVDVALRGFARAAEQAPELRLLLLGAGSQAALVQSIIQSYSLQDRVHLGGRVSQPDLPEVYRSADLYLSASHSDGSSVSLMEALASGLPALVTDIASNREWVSEGVQGCLFPDGDEQALASVMLEMARRPEGLDGMRRAARQQAGVRADWRKNFPVLLQAYAAAVGVVKG